MSRPSSEKFPATAAAFGRARSPRNSVTGPSVLITVIVAGAAASRALSPA
jgi:hypothetical protein